MAHILVVDDDPDFAESLQEQLQQIGHEVQWLDDPEDALRRLGKETLPNLVLLDNCMPRLKGLEFLAAVGSRDLRIPVILMTTAHLDQTLLEAINLGAFGYVIKPARDDELLAEFQGVIEKALEMFRRPPPVPLPTGNSQPEDESVIVGRSRAIVEMLIRTAKVARMEENVLILGESGTGKDLVARAIHTNSRRRNGPFVVMNCASLNENLIESELFGHLPNAFTGADKLRKGRFEHAQGGTLFLDEVGDMPLKMQAALLRALENREITRVGSNDPIKVDVRVVAATFRDLAQRVREGKFREDLFYRLEGMTIHIPPLRERTDDIERLANCFLSRLLGGAEAPRLHPETIARLREYPWPGNVRQLQKVICRAAIRVPAHSQIMPADLDFGDVPSCTAAPQPVIVETGPSKCTEQQALEGLRSFIRWAWQANEKDLWTAVTVPVEKELLRLALEQLGSNEVKLADRLGIARNTLRRRLKDFGLQD